MGSSGLRPRWWLAGSLVAVLAITAFGVWLHLTDGAPTAVDTAWNGFARTTPGSPAFALALGLAYMGGTLGVTMCAAIAVVVLLLRQRGGDAIAVALAALIGVASSELVKLLVARPRPPDALVHPSGFSYPSGHSMGAAVLAVSLVLVILASDHASRRAARWAMLCATIWVLAMMWSRTALGVHWLTDTIAGALLGAVAAIVARALRRTPRPAAAR